MTNSKPRAKYRTDYQAPDFTITDIDLDFQLAPEITTVTATSRVVRKNPQASTLRLDGENLKLLLVEIDQQPWNDYQQLPGALELYHVPAEFTLTIINEIAPQENSALEGLYVSGDALCTQCEAEGFRRITYYLDRPDVLARFSTRITADKQAYPYLLSNGNRMAQGELEDGQHWVQWQDPFPKPSYLFALVAGDFDRRTNHFITRSNRRVALEIYVDKGNLDRSEWAMQSLKNAMRWDEERFGLEYDLDIFMLVAVDFFNMGAMENKGLNIFNSKYVLAKRETATDEDYLGIESVVGHEYFHNWTGNRVTCRDWFQLSLKEGLTVFRDQEFSSDLGSRAVNRIKNVRIMRMAQFAEDAGPMAHPIRPEKVIEMNNFYTLTVYEKGAEVIRMMHTLLGEAKFQAGMQLYFARHDGSAATCDDFVQAMQDASGIDLTHFRLWYSQSGTPQLTVRDRYLPEAQRYILTVKQHTPPTADQKEKQPLHIPLDIELYYPNGEVVELISDGQPVSSVLNVEQAEQQFIFDKVREAPIPSLLREFSAPVKLDYAYSDEQLIFLLQHAGNAFNRYDAAQMLISKYVHQAVSAYQQGQYFALPKAVIEAWRTVLLSDLDPAVIALILTLPTDNELANQFDVVDPEAIFQVRQQFYQQLAAALADDLQTVYQRLQTADYQLTHQAMAERALKNCCLAYLAYLDQDQRLKQHYQQADNMTDSMGALSAAVKANAPVAAELLHDFEQRWQHDGLVMDKWFMLQATSPRHDVLQTVKQLLNHPAFSLSNPNRVRSLIGAFANNNPRAFHAIDGSGYHFLAEILSILNQRNPQVAARLIEPLINLKRYDAKRQQLMRQVLQSLLQLEKLSDDLYEKISKALAD